MRHQILPSFQTIGQRFWARLTPCNPSIVPDFQRLIGRDGWASLPQAVQRRFNYLAIGMIDERYIGRMQSMRVSRAGYWIGLLCRLIGNPLAGRAGSDVPVEISVFRDRSAKGGVVWERRYRYAQPEASAKRRYEPPVRSVKRVNRDGLLVETACFGIGMVLKVFARDGGIIFQSIRYQWALGPVTLRLPDWLTPGRIQVTHHAVGETQFRFTLTADHPWFGETFYQEGIFADVDPSPHRQED